MSFKYDVLGHVRFGSELNDILTLKGIEDIDSFFEELVPSSDANNLFVSVFLNHKNH